MPHEKSSCTWRVGKHCRQCDAQPCAAHDALLTQGARNATHNDRGFHTGCCSLGQMMAWSMDHSKRVASAGKACMRHHEGKHDLHCVQHHAIA